MPEPGHRLAGVILAAGAAKRFGSAKQLATWEGKPLLQRSLGIAAALEDCDVAVVLGAHLASINAQIDLTGVRCIYNAEWTTGIASSIRAAVSALGTDYDALLFIGADQAGLSSRGLSRLIAAWQKQPAHPACACFDQVISIPAIFPRSCYPELMQLEGDGGGKRILRAHAAELVKVPLPEAAIDIDVPADLTRLSTR